MDNSEQCLYFKSTQIRICIRVCACVFSSPSDTHHPEENWKQASHPNIHLGTRCMRWVITLCWNGAAQEGAKVAPKAHRLQSQTTSSRGTKRSASWDKRRRQVCIFMWRTGGRRTLSLTLTEREESRGCDRCNPTQRDESGECECARRQPGRYASGI